MMKSDGWISRFKSRNHFNRGTPQIKKKVKESVKKDYEDMKYTYVCEVEEAVEKYGSACVLNMDETPCKIVEMPRVGWGIKGEDKLQVYTWGDEKQQLTLIPTITASGEKLRLAWIHKAKTYK